MLVNNANEIKSGVDIKQVNKDNRVTITIKLFEEMKLNELNFFGLTSKLMKGVPRMSEFNETTKDRIQKDFLSPDWD